LVMQHVIDMFAGNITPVLILSRVLNLSANETTLLIQCALLSTSIATIIQLYPIKILGKFEIGARLPIVMGLSFGYLPAMLSISNGSAANISIIFGAQIVGGICSVFLGVWFKKIKFFFPPIVAGTSVLAIGLSLFPVGVNYMAGGIGNPTYGSYLNWGISFFVLLTALFINHYGKGSIRMSAKLIAMFLGYMICLSIGLVNFKYVSEANWFSFPKIFAFGMPKFEMRAILIFLIMYLITSVQTVGNFSAVTNGAMKREVRDKELEGGIVGIGFSGIISACLNSFPVAVFSQNVGIVVLTKVISRIVIALSAILLLLAGFIPKFSAIIETIPSPVLGGGVVVVFSLIAMTGIQIITKDGLNEQKMIIAGLSIFIGFGVGALPKSIEIFPDQIKAIFCSNIVIATIFAFILNLLFPPKKEKDDISKGEIIDIDI
ncbi:MAG: uracil-xanthine permease family protein, partial [Fusobacteriaceae bacterium]